MLVLLVMGLLVVGLLVMSAGPAVAQAVDRPSDERPTLEPLGPAESKTPRVPLELPEAPAPLPDSGAFASGLSIILSEIRVEGSTIFTPHEFSKVTRGFENRSMRASDLVDLTNALTQLYVDAGFVSSGASIPDQDLEGGVLRVEVIEARIVDVVVTGNRWQRASYLKSRLMAAMSQPVRVEDVEDQLQLLLQHPDIIRVAGKLVPGPQRGEDVLEIELEEKLPFGLSGTAANDNPPAIGSVRGVVRVEDRSLLGFADPIRADFEFAEGLTAQDVRYEFPISPYGTTLRARFRHTKSDVVQAPFDVANIEIETLSARIAVRHPVFLKPNSHLHLEAMFERRRSTTRLDGERISFVPGPKDGRSDVTLVRFVADAGWRSQDDVVAARSMLTWGFDAWGATNNSGDAPDGKYVSWLGQAQWAHRFPGWLRETQLIVRGDVQLASDALLSLEQIAVGGYRTVRGYRENLLVRDNAAIASAELRVPLVTGRFGSVELAPFYDWGTGWNENETRLPKTIRSAGIGLRFQFLENVHAYAYWAESLRNVPDTGDNIQEDGFHLGIMLRAF